LSLWRDEDVLRADVSKFEALGVEGAGSGNDGVDEVPKFSLLEVLVLHGEAIDDLIAEEVGVVLVLDLGGEGSTVLMPPLPQNSVFSNFWLIGRKMFSNSPISFTFFSQRLNSLSLGSGIMI
jgi:hypothetical protein